MKKNLSAPAPREQPLEDWIRERAYYLWLNRGCPHGEDWRDWFLAKAQLETESGPPSTTVYPSNPDNTRHFSIRHTIDEHQSDPAHRFHAPTVTHDARLNVAANEAPQRIRGRHFENAERKPGKNS